MMDRCVRLLVHLMIKGNFVNDLCMHNKLITINVDITRHFVFKQHFNYPSIFTVIEISNICVQLNYSQL